MNFGRGHPSRFDAYVYQHVIFTYVLQCKPSVWMGYIQRNIFQMLLEFRERLTHLYIGKDYWDQRTSFL